MSISILLCYHVPLSANLVGLSYCQWKRSVERKVTCPVQRNSPYLVQVGVYTILMLYDRGHLLFLAISLTFPITSFFI